MPPATIVVQYYSEVRSQLPSSLLQRVVCLFFAQAQSVWLLGPRNAIVSRPFVFPPSKNSARFSAPRFSTVRKSTWQFEFLLGHLKVLMKFFGKYVIVDVYDRVKYIIRVICIPE